MFQEISKSVTLEKLAANRKSKPSPVISLEDNISLLRYGNYSLAIVEISSFVIWLLSVLELNYLNLIFHIFSTSNCSISIVLLFKGKHLHCINLNHVCGYLLHSVCYSLWERLDFHFGLQKSGSNILKVHCQFNTLWNYRHIFSSWLFPHSHLSRLCLDIRILIFIDDLLNLKNWLQSNRKCHQFILQVPI